MVLFAVPATVHQDHKLFYQYVNLLPLVLLLVSFWLCDDWHGGVVAYECPPTNNRVFVCRNNDLTEIPKGIDPETESIDLANNAIVVLHEDAFRNLKNLRRLNLDNNKLWKVTDLTFSDLRDLEELSLINNNIVIRDHAFSASSFTYLPRLRRLDLSQNPLGHLPRGVFSKLRSLRVLHMNNVVRGLKISEGALEGLENLQELSLTQLGLQSLPKYLERDFKAMNLERLYFDSNPWKCDCNLRWLRRWYTERTSNMRTSLVYHRRLNYNDISPLCSSPSQFRNRGLFNLSISDFQCLPTAKSIGSVLRVKEGANVSFACAFYSDPKTYVEWYKGSVLIQNHWVRMKINTTKGNDFTTNLTVYSVRKEDQGQFQCAIKNGRGSAEVNHTLLVIVRQVRSLKLDKVVILVGIGASGLVILLAAIGIIVYCFYGRDPTKPLIRGGSLVVNANGGGPGSASGSGYDAQQYKQQQQPLLMANGNLSGVGGMSPHCGDRALGNPIYTTSGGQRPSSATKHLLVNSMGGGGGGCTMTSTSVPMGVQIPLDRIHDSGIVSNHTHHPQLTMPDPIPESPPPDHTHNDDCPVHGNRLNYSPCPVHGGSSSQNNNNNSSSSPYGTLNKSSTCPVHQNSSSDIPVRSRSPMLPDGQSSSAYIRASRIDDCVTPSSGLKTFSGDQHAGLVLPSSTGAAADGSIEFYHPAAGLSPLPPTPLPRPLAGLRDNKTDSTTV